MSTADSGNFTSFGGPNEGFGGGENLGGTPPLNPKEVSQQEVDALSNQLSNVSPEATRTVYDSYGDNKENSASSLSFGGSPTTETGGMGSGFESETSAESQESQILAPGEIKGLTGRSIKSSGERTRNDRQQGVDAQTIRERRAAEAEDTKELAENSAVQLIVDLAFGSTEESKEIATKLKEIFSEYGGGNIGVGMQLLRTDYLRVKDASDAESVHEAERIKSIFSEAGFTNDQTNDILRELIRDTSRPFIEEAARASGVYESAILALENGTDTFIDEQEKLSDQDLTDDELTDAIDDTMQKVVDEELARNPNSVRARRLQRNLQGIRELKLERREAERILQQEEIQKIQKTTNITSQTAATLVEFGVGARVLAGLPPEGQTAVENVVQNGGGRMMGVVLANPETVNESEYIGTVAGESVALNFASSKLYLIGENAGDRANTTTYPIDPPTPAGFEGVLIQSVGDQNRMPYIAQHGAQARAMYEEIGSDPNDESFPEPEDITRFRNFLVLLVGEGSPDQGQEEARLQKLGILSDGVESVDRTRVKLFGEAIERYVPGGLQMQDGESSITSTAGESPVFNYEDALTLAALWNKNRTAMPGTITELKKMTEARLRGDAPDTL